MKSKSISANNAFLDELKALMTKHGIKQYFFMGSSFSPGEMLTDGYSEEIFPAEFQGYGFYLRCI